MKIKFISIVILFIFGNCVMISQTLAQLPNKSDSLIVGTWISEEDNTWKMVFNTDSICTWYYENTVTDTFTYKVANTSPQCGTSITVDDRTIILSLKNIQDNDEICYYIFGCSDMYLSMHAFDKGGMMVFVRQDE